MATVTKPMALDESFNTTESTSRNVADVLAEGLDNIAESILPKAATEIPIESGSSTNTKAYIDSLSTYKKGQVLSADTHIGSGYITQGYNGFLMILPRRIASDITTVAVTISGSLYLYSTNGRYGITTSNIASTTIFRNDDYNSCINFSLNSGVLPSSVAGTPCTIAFDGTITFG